MIRLSWTLLRGGGRTELVRLLLVGLAAALATGFLLGVSLLTAVTPPPATYTGDPRYPSLVDEAGLRSGVMVALALLTVPVVIMLAMTTRLGGTRRDRRTAALRLVGATREQVRWLSAMDSLVCSAVGAAVALVGVVGLKAALERQHVDGTTRTLPTDVALPVLPTAAVLVVVPLLCASAAVLAQSRVETTPLGVVRRERVTPPRPWPFLLLVAGTGLVAVGAHELQIEVTGVGAALALLGLAGVPGWVAYQVGSRTAVQTTRADLLLAARRLEADPHAQGRALSAVVLAVFVGAGAAALRAGVTARSEALGYDTRFFDNAYGLIDLGLLVAAGVGVVGLAVATVERVVDQRRSLAVLVAVGVPRPVLRRALLLQALLPAVPSVLLATGMGATAGAVYDAAGNQDWALDGRVLLVPLVGLGLVLLSAASTLPVQERATSPSELRFA